MLICDKVSFARERILFDGLGLCLRPATAIGLKGANGSGKTTLLRGLAGLTPPTS
ncbi:MAG: ATP-binding cassette domain-containing protein, partial [Alphaproteobacteria bacterium]|nr:ATP-binding cassette domain-containing protein [Alphaproteobacteria bacterium]